MSVAQETPRGTSRRPWAWVVAGAAAWAGLFVANEVVWDWLVFDLAGFNGHLGDAVHFFLFDMGKILLLLTAVVFAAAVLRTFVSPERTRALLGGRRQGLGNLAAAGLGVATPFCSCSAVPLFIGFVAAGVPLGITMSFLIASPMVNEVALVLLWSTFGWRVALLYAGLGLLIAIVAGLVIGHLRPERWVERFVFQVQVGAAAPGARQSWAERFATGRAEARAIVGRVWPFLLGALAVGAAIHGWVPQDFFVRYAGPGNPWSVPLAVVLGIPLYSNAAGTIPLIEALHAKGLALGTVLAFTMAVVALSLPEMILLRRVLRPRLLGMFIGVVAVGIVATGYLFNAVL
ncbi:MAG: permease [Actinomycetota bacterium]